MSIIGHSKLVPPLVAMPSWIRRQTRNHAMQNGRDGSGAAVVVAVAAAAAAVASDDVVARRPYRPLLVPCYGLFFAVAAAVTHNADDETF